MIKEQNTEYKVKMLLFLLVLMFVLLVGCSSSEVSPKNSIDQQIENIKNTANKLTESIEISKNNSVNKSIVSPTQQSTQIVIIPPNVDQQSLSPNYVSQCFLRKYKILNLECSFKDFWHNQSTLLSWYVSYSVISFLLFVFIIIIIFHLWRNR